jgi:hypothetical protein
MANSATTSKSKIQAGAAAVEENAAPGNGISSNSHGVSGRGVVRNPDHHLSAEVRKAFDARYAALHEQLDLRNDTKRVTEIHREYSTGLLDIYKTAFAPTGVNLQQLSDRVRDLTIAKNEKIADAIKVQAEVERLRFPPQYANNQAVPIPKPLPQDPTFWWADTTWWTTTGQAAAFPNDGLSFYDGPKINDSDGQESTNFGAIAFFELNRDRIPASPSGNWVSNPWVDLIGGMTLFAPGWDLIQGHGIANVNLYLRQTLYQNDLGGQKTVAENIVPAGVWWLNLEDTDYSQNKILPGSHFNMPTVSLSKDQFNPNESLWAELEIRFDINLKAEGALAWADPYVLFRTYQWPLLVV